MKHQNEMYMKEITHTFVAGTKIKISCQILTQFILNMNEQIHDDNMSHCLIHNLFDNLV
jgi:hypothetical protein